MKNTILSLIITLSFTQLCVSQQEMTLEKAISLGLENNYGIKIADINIQIADNNNTWARAGRAPIINLGLSLSNTIVNDNNPASFLQGTYYSGSLGPSVDVQWIISNGGRIKFSKEQFGILGDQQRLNKDVEIHNLLITIYQQYYQVLFLQEQFEVLESNLSLSRDKMNYEITRRSFGATNSFNLIQFENAILTDSTNIVSQQQAISTAKRNLYNTLDIRGMQNFSFSERLNTTVEDIDVDKLSEVLSEENYTLKTLEVIASLNRLNTKLNEASLKPTISLSASGGITENAFKFYADNPNTGEAFTTQLSERLNASINANLSWNLYDGGVRKTNLQNAKLQEEIDLLGLLEAKAEINNQLDILVENYHNQVDLLEMADRQVQLAQRNLEMTEERFKAGQITSLDYRNIQTQFLSASFNKVGAIFNLILTKSEIDFLVGKFD